ncbi:hypothetical protein JCM19297_1141 [Nonlabens ulvanivorans]|nr:hypothetical protein [Nonlabens ulvanivorans]GAK89313.1 hypothetical protein JCM19297_1141 [Nonlabens ulvanivorans]
MKTSLSIQDSLLPFLPLLYIAWGDGVLEEHEMAFIKKQIEENDTINPDTKLLVYKWLDPTNQLLQENSLTGKVTSDNMQI